MTKDIIDPKSIRAGTPDWQEGYSEGKKYARNKVHELLQEVIDAYESTDVNLKFPAPPISALKGRKDRKQSQINAVKFAQKWVASGGETDIDGNRACFPW